MSHPATVVAQELRKRQPDDRGRFLRDLIAHAAATLTMIEGEEASAEALYRTADAVVGCTGEPA